MRNKHSHKKIAVLIPCRNEAEGIASVIRDFPYIRLHEAGFSIEVIVIDNNSSDATAEIARAQGARVIHERKRGKGNAVRCGFDAIPYDAEYVVMIDGDTTYQPSEILRLIEPLESGFCSVVVGSRLTGKIRDGAMSGLNRLGNWIFSLLVRFFYQANVTDVLTGYFAWTREALLQLRPHVTSGDFGIEMDMVTKMAKLGEVIHSVPITYTVRSGDSNLRPFADGYRILKVFLRNLVWKPMGTFSTHVPHIREHASHVAI
jgi:dolichol-phosphate mannosyltransferase